MTYEDWAKAISPLRAVAFMAYGWGFLLCGSWRSGYPFAAMTVYTPRRNFRPFHLDRRPGH